MWPYSTLPLYANPLLKSLPRKERWRILRKVKAKTSRNHWQVPTIWIAAILVNSFLVMPAIRHILPGMPGHLVSFVVLAVLLYGAMIIESRLAIEYLLLELHRYCAQCGHKLDENSKDSCPECGTPIQPKVVPIENPRILN